MGSDRERVARIERLEKKKQKERKWAIRNGATTFQPLAWRTTTDHGLQVVVVDVLPGDYRGHGSVLMQ